MIIPEYVLLLGLASILISVLVANRVVTGNRFKSENILGLKILVFVVSTYISYFVLEKIVRFDFYKLALETQLQCWRNPSIKSMPKQPYSVVLHRNASELVRSYNSIMASDGILKFPKKQSIKLEKYQDINHGTFDKNLKHYFLFDSNVKGISKGVYLYKDDHDSDGVLLVISKDCFNGYDSSVLKRCISNKEYNKDMAGDYAIWTYSYKHELSGYFSIESIMANLIDKSGTVIYRKSHYAFNGSRIEDSEKTLNGWAGNGFSCES